MPVWIDEIGDVEAWKAEFLKPEAREVIEAVGAWIYCFPMPITGLIDEGIEETMKAIQDINEEHAGYGSETVILAIGMPAANAKPSGLAETREEWDDRSMEYGFEFVDYTADGKNEFGEKVGLERLREALEANEWAATATAEGDELDFDLRGLDDNDEGDIRGFARDEAEMTAELFGMKAALNGNDLEPEADDLPPPASEETQVEDLDRLMGRLLAVKEQSADLPESERKRLAAKAVRELLAEGKVP